MRFIIVLLFLQMGWAMICPAQTPDFKAAKNILTSVQKKSVKSSGQTFTYKETKKTFGHFSKPWKMSESTIEGAFTIIPGTSTLYISDSIIGKKRNYKGVVIYNDTIFAKKFPGSEEWAAADIEDKELFLYSAALYSPLFIVNDFLKHGEKDLIWYAKGNKDTVVYRRGESIISIIVNKQKQVATINILSADEMYGDVVQSIEYSKYEHNKGIYYPTEIKEILHDSVTVSMQLKPIKQPLDISAIAATLPKYYAVQPVAAKPDAAAIYTRYNDNIYLVDLPHTDERSLIVNFRDFLLVAEAPLNTENGAMIINKAQELFPGKPIRYFVAGHHHPHYLGGVRAFIHNGTTILTTPLDTAYITQLVQYRHTIKPDALENEPMPLKTELIDGIKKITDSSLSMHIIHIGNMSQHTEDYLVYYFPQYKLLFEDDLVWIKKDKAVTGASERQKGLYDAIKKYSLEVDTIIQGWPIKNYDVKSIISFEELEQSVQMIK